MSTVRKSLKQFIAANRIRIVECTMVDCNPNCPERNDAYHYRITLGRGRKRYTLHFSTGYGWDREPGVSDILECLVSDSAGVENAQSFEDWCAEYGYDSDSRKAESTYKTCLTQSQRLKQFLGDDLFSALLWETEF